MHRDNCTFTLCDVRQTEIHAAEPLVPKPSLLIQTGGNNVLRTTDLFILFGTRKNCHNSGRILLLYLFVKSMIHLPSRSTKGMCYHHCFFLRMEGPRKSGGIGIQLVVYADVNL
jgi:hypothetical protein